MFFWIIHFIYIYIHIIFILYSIEIIYQGDLYTSRCLFSAITVTILVIELTRLPSSLKSPQNGVVVISLELRP